VVPRDAVSITGRFRLLDGTSGDGNSFSLENLEPETGSVVINSIARDGAFRLDHVPEGRYVIAPSPNLSGRRTYIASARLGGREVIEDAFEINEGSSKTLEIVLNGGSGAVYGVLQDSRGAGVAFGRVVLVPAPERRGNPHLFFTAMSDHLGAFKLDAVPPGNYEVFGWDYVEEFAYLNPDFLRKFDGRSTPIRIEPRATSRFLVPCIEHYK
jgi:hypothetical protein